jgi:hypothetical protein
VANWASDAANGAGDGVFYAGFMAAQLFLPKLYSPLTNLTVSKNQL